MLPFKTLGEYGKFTDLLGCGAYGVVKKIQNKGQSYAVKAFNTWGNYGIDHTTLREISTLKYLDHPNIIKMVDVCNFGLDYFLSFRVVLELANTSLEKWLPNMNKNKIKIYMKQLISGLNYMHDNGVWHRDIKPANILVFSDDRICYTDFGSARSLSSYGNECTNVDIQSLYWRAPELIIESKFYDGKVDVFSLGLVYAEMYLGKNVFTECSPTHMLAAQIKLLGKLHFKEWPELEQSLTYITLVSFHTESLGDQWQEKLPDANENEIEIIRRMTYPNPAKRPTAKEIFLFFHLMDNNRNEDKKRIRCDDMNISRDDQKLSKIVTEETINPVLLRDIYDVTVRICYKYKISLKTFLHSKVLFENYLSQHVFYDDLIIPSDENYIKLMITCLFLSSKMIDRLLLDISLLSDEFKNIEEIFTIERHIIKALNFNLVFPTIFSYVDELTLEIEVRNRSYIIAIIYMINSLTEKDKFDDEILSYLAVSYVLEDDSDSNIERFKEVISKETYLESIRLLRKNM